MEQEESPNLRGEIELMVCVVFEKEALGHTTARCRTPHCKIELLRPVTHVRTCQPFVCLAPRCELDFGVYEDVMEVCVGVVGVVGVTQIGEVGVTQMFCFAKTPPTLFFSPTLCVCEAAEKGTAGMGCFATVLTVKTSGKPLWRPRAFFHCLGHVNTGKWHASFIKDILCPVAGDENNTSPGFSIFIKACFRSEARSVRSRETLFELGPCCIACHLDGVFLCWS